MPLFLSKHGGRSRTSRDVGFDAPDDGSSVAKIFFVTLPPSLPDLG